MSRKKKKKVVKKPPHPDIEWQRFLFTMNPY